MKNIISFFFILLISFDSISQNKVFDFTINGKINPIDTGYIRLRYINAFGDKIEDTCYINNGQFSFKGYVNKCTLASLYGSRVKSRNIDDPFFTEIFIEPKIISVELDKDNFKRMYVEGSITQKAFDSLRNEESKYQFLSKNIDLEIEDEKKKYRDMIDEFQREKSNRKIINLRVLRIPYEDSVRKLYLNYVRGNPNSYLSPYLLFANYRDELNKDTLRVFFNSMSRDVQESKFGRLLRGQFEKKDRSEIGKPAPQFMGKQVNGSNFSLSQNLDKKYSLINFWASWCIPCRASVPALKQIKRKYSKKGFDIIGISIDEDKASWKKAIKKDQSELFIHLIAKDLYLSNARRDIQFEYDVPFIPVLYLVDKNGIIIDKWKGGSKEVELLITRKLETIFKAH